MNMGGFYLPNQSVEAEHMASSLTSTDFEILGISTKHRNEKYKRWSIDQIMMSTAYIMAKGSHDSDTQHGAVIVDENNHIVSSGFNGFLKGSADDILPNARLGGHKYKFMVHAERNACDQATRADLSNCRIFVTGVPCNDCMTTIINRGIRIVTYGDVGHVQGEGFWEMHKYLINAHNVSVTKYSGQIINVDNAVLISI